ncbi:hypothetical protein HDV06_004526 [Boothiomyces sp. JEL0866]|nr:hypothetical protein HDV06_004526 [Boothiomyces sp. JEL0866]
MYRFKKTIREPNVFYISQYGITIDGIEPLYYPIMWFVDTRDLNLLFSCLKHDGKVHLRWRTSTMNSVFCRQDEYTMTLDQIHQNTVSVNTLKYDWVEFESLRADNFVICKITRKKMNILYAKSFIEYFCSKIGVKIETSFIFSNIIRVIDYINNSF